MKTEEKIWIVFLAHLYYEIENKINFYFSKNLAVLTPVLEMWDKFGPKMIDVWKNGNLYIDPEDRGDRGLLCLDYRSYMPNDIFIKVFGVDTQQSYCRAIHMSIAKLTYRIEDGEMFFFSGDTNFHFKEGVIKPYLAAHADKTNQERLEKGFDKDFLVFFEKHIGLDFSGAENFFEVYLRSKLNQTK